MEPRHAWGAFSVILVLGISVAGTVLVSIGHDALLIAAFAACAVVAYAYVAYKRYHVELVPESDIMLFDDAEDLKLLCRIYGLGSEGGRRQLRARLLRFSRQNRGKSFVWVAPSSVRALAGAFTLEPRLREPLVPTPLTSPSLMHVPGVVEHLVSDQPSAPSLKPGLMGGLPRSPVRLRRVRWCPICDSRRLAPDPVCASCGADIEFYVVLSQTRVGRRMLSAKAAAGRRKLRYPVSALKEP